MNWLYIKKHYVKMFVELTGVKSVGEEAMKVNYSKAKSMTIEELNKNISKIEEDMLLITQYTTENNKNIADILLSWNINMIENYIFVINEKWGCV